MNTDLDLPTVEDDFEKIRGFYNNLGVFDINFVEIYKSKTHFLVMWDNGQGEFVMQAEQFGTWVKDLVLSLDKAQREKIALYLNLEFDLDE